MNILGIETSTPCCSVGFINEDGASVERSLVESHVHSEKLQTLIATVLEEAKTPFAALDVVAVSVGPGSFTGLRIGLSSAKGLCYAIGRPIVSVSTFESMANVAARTHELITDFVILLDAKQSDFYVGRFVRRGTRLEVDMEAAVKSLAKCVHNVDLDEHTLVVTDSAQRIQDAFGRRLHCEPPENFCRGDIVAQMGLQKYLSKQFSDLDTLEPMYLKDFLVRQQPVNTHA